MSRPHGCTRKRHQKEGHEETKLRKSQFKSIFDLNGSSLLQCLAVVVYFREETHTQVLWLSTTLEAPPKDSSHVIWRKMGLATYLLCMLVKQHTGIGDGTMDRSCLSVQVSMDDKEEAGNFYIKLGFLRVNESFNGLSKTSTGFQEAVKTSPKVWVPARTQPTMSLFQLKHGRLFLSLIPIDLTLSDSGSPYHTHWKLYPYSQFPWKFESMMKIEASLRTRPILKFLSGEALPRTDRPLSVFKSVSRMSGLILGGSRVSFNSSAWLSCQDIQFLFALLLRNPMAKSGFVHVIGPSITQHISMLKGCIDTVVSKNATVKEQDVYDSNLASLQQYIESRLDILQHKFLVFVFNVNNDHWVSVVVINTKLVFARYLNEGNELSNTHVFVDQEEIAGWCVLDSMHGVSDRNGFKGSFDTTIKEPYGFRLFLNICASIIKDMDQKKGPGGTSEFAYVEPFGSYKECNGTEGFPRLDYKCPSIIQQSTLYDCGLAAVANSMAFVKQLQHVKFSRSTMQRVQSNGVSFVLKEQIFSLKPFWEKLLLDCSRTKHDTVVNSTLLLKFMRTEYVEVVDFVASQCVTDRKCYDQVLEVLAAHGLQTCADAQVGNVKDSKPSAHELKEASIDLTEAPSTAQKSADDRKRSATSPDDRKPSAIDTEAASMKEAASAMTLLREGDSGSERVVVKLDFEEGSPDGATLTEQSDKQMSVTGGLKRKRTIKTDTTVCLSGDSCRLLDVKVVCQGEEQNGSACCKCEGTFHHVCLFAFQGYMYCSNCYRTDVVSQCSTETLFKDLFVIDPSAANGGSIHTNKELLQFTDRFLKDSGLEMTLNQFYVWRKKCQQFARKQSWPKKKCNKAEREKRAHTMYVSDHRKRQYEKVIKLASEEWMLSTDGVVKSLRYTKEHNGFVAKCHYKKGHKVIEQSMSVTDAWVIDTYGKELANKLIDREDHDGFIKALKPDGVLAVIPLDERNITRVKYHSPTFFHTESNTGCDQVTNQVCAKGMWKGQLADGSVKGIAEEVVLAQFGSRFVEECKALGSRKFVPVPVGNCNSSVIAMLPHLKSENAPPVKFMQGPIDSCAFSSLASAFYHTNNPDLVRVANILQEESLRFSGRSNCIDIAKGIVENNVRWLIPKRIPKKFDWEHDINDYMFVAGVIKDSIGACQHAVAIFRDWIYDSNEPFALPLSKQSLDCCTWDIQDGAVDVASSFVCFCDGWIFQEQTTRKKKFLDRIFPPATNVEQA